MGLGDDQGDDQGDDGWDGDGRIVAHGHPLPTPADSDCHWVTMVTMVTMI